MEECNESFKCLFKNIITLYKTPQRKQPNANNPTQSIKQSNNQTTNGNSKPKTD